VEIQQRVSLLGFWREGAVSRATAHAGPNRLREHWRWRPDWTPDRVGLWWYLTFGDHPQVAATSNAATSVLGTLPYLDVPPPAWLHLTLREVGFKDEVAPETVRECIARTRRALASWEPFALWIGTVGVLTGAVVLWAEPRQAVQRLRGELSGRCAPPTGLDGFPAPDAVRPHVSLAYVGEDCDPAPVLAHLPDPAPVQVSVSKVTLAAVTRHDHRYQWDVQASVPFGSQVVSGRTELEA
jgi:2'-5' RNA ligase